MPSFLTAISFLTIFPFASGKAVEPRELASSMALFPLVGVWLGACMWLMDKYLCLIFPVWVVACLIVAFLAVVTGGLHLDGFADTLDGFYAGRGDRARTLEVMKDSRVGAMGVIGLLLLLLLKVAAIAGIPSGLRGQALLVMPAISRWSQVQLSIGSEYARKEGSLAKAFIEFLEWKHFATATIVTCVAVVLLSGTRGMAAFAVAGLFTFGAKAYFKSRIGGVTGDTIGAVNEINEVLALLVFCASLEIFKG
jgi:adenosylcobinamide-GDP ribazoletransferase